MKVSRVDHISFTVSDPERIAEFYKRFGYESFKNYSLSGPDLSEGTDTQDAQVEIVWLRRPGEQTMLELVQYVKHPGGRALHNSKVGAAHLCFAVDDMDAAYDELLADGVPFHSAPHEDQYGVRWVYMHDPDGNTVEILQDAADGSELN
jgi:catechol 2,3-dioxygenase-like lactoylglutathione lyase family enzyme